MGIAVAVLAGCSTGATSTPTATGVDLPAGFPLGTWTVTMTEQDLRDAGITEPGLLAENTGLFTRTYAADGSWTIAQQTTQPIRWPVFRGTFRATGPNEIEETTVFPTEYAGDVVKITWQREGSAIRLKVLNPPDPILPILTETRAWQPG